MSIKHMMVCDGCSNEIAGDYCQVRQVINGRMEDFVHDYCQNCYKIPVSKEKEPSQELIAGTFIPSDVTGRKKIIMAIELLIKPRFQKVTAAMVSEQLIKLGIVNHEDKRSIGDCLGGHGLQLPWKKVNGQRWYLFDNSLLDDSWNITELL